MNNTTIKRVLITGASRGIGKAIALEYAKRNYTLTLLARNTDELKKTVERINYQKPDSAFYHQCDVTNKESVREAIEFASRSMGGIDIAILNAGINRKNIGANYSFSETLEEIFHTNVFGMMYCIENILPLMKQKGEGTIAGVGSLSDFRGAPGFGIYNTSKIAVSYLLESLRIENLDTGVKIINIRPGFISTDMVSDFKFKMPFLMNPERAAKIIVEGIDKQKSVIAFPLPVRIGSLLLKMLPSFIYEKGSDYFINKYK
ncbi:MAG: SDR family NAD(P)-dependent oxidoreductase [Bacteroidota bacterium]